MSPSPRPDLFGISTGVRTSSSGPPTAAKALGGSSAAILEKVDPILPPIPGISWTPEAILKASTV